MNHRSRSAILQNIIITYFS